MALAVGETKLAGTTLNALILPEGSRTPTKRVITVGTTPVAVGDKTASLQADTAATAIPAGTSLSFNAASPSGATQRKQIIIKNDVTLGTSASNADIFSARRAVPAAEVADFIVGLTPVFGLQEFGNTGNSTTVDTTDTLSGAGTEMAIIRNGYEFSITLIERVADKGLETVIKRVAYDFAFIGREIYAVLTYPDGEVFRGAAKIQNPSKPGNQNEVKKFTFTLAFQGESFEQISAYTFAP